MKKGDIRSFRQALRVLEREVSMRLALEESCCGVTLAQCHVLLELEINDGIMLTGLAAVTGLDKSTLSRTVDALVQAGMVVRNIPADNRRAVSLSLTEKGDAEAERINEICDRYYEIVMKEIGASKCGAVTDAMKCAGAAFEKVRLSKKECCGGLFGRKED